MRKVVILLVVTMCGIAVAGPDWDNDTGNRLWSDPLNWVGDVLPGGTGNDSPCIDVRSTGGDTNGPIINTDANDMYRVWHDMYGDVTGPMIITGSAARLKTLQYWLGATPNANAQIDMDGGLLEVSSFYLGHKQWATLNVSGGLVNCYTGTGEIIIGNKTAGDSWGKGFLNITGTGEVRANTLVMNQHPYAGEPNEPSRIYITDSGVLKLDTDVQGQVNAWVAAGWIYTDGNRDIDVSYDGTWTETIVTASPKEFVTWDGSESSDWTEADNWDCNGVPSVGNNVVIDTNSPNWPTISSSVSNVNDVNIATVADVNAHLVAGLGCKIGTNKTTLGAAANTEGTLWMSGGYFVASTLELGVSGHGQVNLDDGLLHAGSIDFGLSGGTGKIDITRGELVLNGDQTAAVAAWIVAGQITAYGGFGELIYDYDNIRSGMTAVLAVSMDFNDDGLVNFEDLAVFVDHWLE